MKAKKEGGQLFTPLEGGHALTLDILYINASNNSIIRTPSCMPKETKNEAIEEVAEIAIKQIIS